MYHTGPPGGTGMGLKTEGEREASVRVLTGVFGKEGERQGGQV
jgi:hypothetical protein